MKDGDHKEKKKILILDDDGGILESLKTALEMVGYEVVGLPDGKQIETYLLKFDPHLILMDLKLGEISGETIIQKLKQHTQTAQIPIIVLSAHPQASRIASEAGVDFLAKPFDLYDLLAKSKHLINSLNKST